MGADCVKERGEGGSFFMFGGEQPRESNMGVNRVKE